MENLNNKIKDFELINNKINLELLEKNQEINILNEELEKNKNKFDNQIIENEKLKKEILKMEENIKENIKELNEKELSIKVLKNKNKEYLY